MSVLEDVEPEADGRTLHIRPAELVETELVEQALAEGDHRIELSVGRMFLPDATFRWTYVVDSIAPTLDVPASLPPVRIDEPVTIEGGVEDDVELRLDDRPIENDGGTFAVDFDTPPTGSLAFEAIDEAGNRTLKHVVVPVAYPDAFRGVHVSATAWADDELRAGIEDLIDRHLVDTVELDLKDESGIVGYDSELVKAKEIGAVTADYDLSETVEYLESKGIRVIGRLVAFRDPIYANAAWAAGDRDQVVQNPDGGKFSSYGGFTNFSHDAVHEDNRSIALEAESMGVKDILWDYIRRPEGDPDTMVIRGSRVRARTRSPRSSPRCSASSDPTAPTKVPRCSASWRRRATASLRTSRRWERWSTTWRRWSTRRTGGPACTASTTQSGSPTTS